MNRRSSAWLSNLTLALALSLAWPASRFAQAPAAPAVPKQLVAVLDFDMAGGTKNEASAVSDRLREELLKSGRYTLVDRSQLDAILNEQALQQTGCTSQECAVKVGKILGVRHMVSGKIVKLSDTLWQVSAQVIDVETSEVLRVATVTQEGRYLDLLMAGVGELANRLVGEAPSAGGMALRGRVVITSEPSGGDIVLDGLPLPQKTELALESLPLGQHTVTVTKGNLGATQSFVVIPGAPMRIALTLKQMPTSLQVMGVPDRATVVLDGKEMGQTPLLFAASPGSHTLEVRHDGYRPVKTDVTLKPDTVTRADVTLEPKGTEDNQYEQALTSWGSKTGWATWSVVIFGIVGLGSYAEVQNYNQDQTKQKNAANSAATFQAQATSVSKMNSDRQQAVTWVGIQDDAYAIAALAAAARIWLQYIKPQPPGGGTIQVSAAPPATEKGLALTLNWSW